MIEKVNGEVKAILFATHIKRYRTKILRRLKDGLSDTYQLYMDKNTLDRATIRKVDTTDYIAAVEFDEEWVFDLTDSNDRCEFIKHMYTCFGLLLNGTETSEQIYDISYRSENRTFVTQKL